MSILSKGFKKRKIKVILHLGVHKTGTTYIQSRLANSIDELNANNIDYIELKKIRSDLTSKLGKPWFSSNDIKNYISENYKRGVLIISDENIIGGTDKIDKYKFYPKASKRLKKLAAGLSEFDVVVHVTIRDYVNYMISRYTEYLRHFEFLSFSDYYKDVKIDQISWTALLEDVHEVGFDKVLVSDFDSVFSDDESYLNMIVGDGVKLGEATNNRHVTRGKLSKEGMDVVEFFAERYSRKATRYLLGVIDANDQETKKTQFMPFSDEEQNMLHSLYKSDIDKIKSDSRWDFF